MPNSSMFVLPTGTAPAATSRATAVAVYGDTKPSSALEPQDSRIPATATLSFTPKGSPASGPPPDAPAEPRERAAFEAASSSISRNDPILASQARRYAEKPSLQTVRVSYNFV